MFSMIIPQIVLTMTVFAIFYVFLYPPQAAIAFFFNGPSGIVTAWLALLHESTVASQLLSEIFLLPTPLQMLFDAV
jgi:hypothetical protein